MLLTTSQRQQLETTSHNFQSTSQYTLTYHKQCGPTMGSMLMEASNRARTAFRKGKATFSRAFKMIATYLSHLCQRVNNIFSSRYRLMQCNTIKVLQAMSSTPLANFNLRSVSTTRELSCTISTLAQTVR